MRLEELCRRCRLRPVHELVAGLALCDACLPAYALAWRAFAQQTLGTRDDDSIHAVGLDGERRFVKPGRGNALVRLEREEPTMLEVDIWILRDESWRGIDVTGFDVEATDGEIGKVDEATYDVRANRIVVDTGPWIFGRKVILPAGLIERIDEDGKKVYVACTKEQIKNAPHYEDANLDEEERHRKALSDHYGAPSPGGPARKPPTVV